MRLVKGVIMEVKQTTAYVLTENGDFVSCDIGNAQVSVGSQIQMKVTEEPIFEAQPMDSESDYLRMKRLLARQEMKKELPKVARLAAVAALFAVSIVGSWSYSWQHVFMEVNPAIDVSYNIYHRVIGIEGTNGDGKKIASELKLYGSKLDEALIESLSVMKNKGYLKQDAGVIIGVNEQEEGQKLKTAIAASTIAEKMNVSIASVKVEKATVKESKEVNSTPIQLEIIKKSMTIEEKEAYVKDKSIVKEQVKAFENKSTFEIIEESAPVLDVKTQEIKKKKNRNITPNVTPDLTPDLTPDQKLESKSDPKLEPKPNLTPELNPDPDSIQLSNPALHTEKKQVPVIERPVTPKKDKKVKTERNKETPIVIQSPKVTKDIFQRTKPPVNSETENPLVSTPKPLNVPPRFEETVETDGMAQLTNETTEEKVVLGDNQKVLAPDLQKKVDLIQSELVALKKIPETFKEMPKQDQLKILRQKVNRAISVNNKIETMKITSELKRDLKMPFEALIKRYEKWMDQISNRP